MTYTAYAGYDDGDPDNVILEGPGGFVTRLTPDEADSLADQLRDAARYSRANA